MSRTSALTRKPKGLGRRNFAQGYPRSHETPTSTSRSKGQKSRSRGGGILWRPPSPTACYNCENITDCYNLLVNRHRNLHRNLFLKLNSREFRNISKLPAIEQLDLEYSEQPYTSQRLAVTLRCVTITLRDILTSVILSSVFTDGSMSLIRVSARGVMGRRDGWFDAPYV